MDAAADDMVHGTDVLDAFPNGRASDTPGGGGTLPLLRLLQLADSAFPVGGFAYSHGLEELAARRPPGERELASIIHGYVAHAGRGQWLPAARAAAGARSLAGLLRIDDALDASIATAGERAAGQAMGERLLVAAEALTPQAPHPASQERGSDAAAAPASDLRARDSHSSALNVGLGDDPLGTQQARTTDTPPLPQRRERGPGGEGAMLAAVRDGATPGQFAVAFGAVGRELGIPVPMLLAGLGMVMAASIVQAAVRLGLIGQVAATRLTAGAAPAIDAAVAATLRSPLRARFGAFTPALDVAGARHPTLPFRMFAS